jgi:hypothetical protein
MQVAGMMIGAAGDCTIWATIERGSDGRYHSSARAFDHPNLERTLPPRTVVKHKLNAEGNSAEEAIQALERALVEQLGPVDWMRWRFFEDK